MKKEYKIVKTHSFEDSRTIYRKTTIFGISFVREIRDWSDMWGKHLPMLTSKSGAEITLHKIKLGGTTYKWTPLGYRNRKVNPW